ncbi:anoctamin-8-like isoform X1 [Asterias rubens]|uniref:anoctamin-8-like isoform X1 n=1 Tax=Asterias rubens TaxID=7604 RepID=UPI0014551EDD|nr:anoctamin-8-like isoform X1 [Asterias rubens]
MEARVEQAKIFGKKFARTNKFIHTNKLWMQTIPTRDCDVLMTFPAKTDDDTLMWLLSRFRARTPQLGVHVRHHGHTGVYGFYLTATYSHLLKGGEELGLRKPLKEEYGGGLKEFTCAEESIFEGVDNEKEFFSSQQRQAIVNHMLLNLRAVDGDKIGKVRFHEGQAIVPKLLSRGIVSQVLPLHNSDTLKSLKTTWVQAFFRNQPLDDICEYFGVKIAMYFAWLGQYTKALFFPALLGAILTFYTTSDQASEDFNFVIFTIFNIIWATLYLESWKRRGAELAYHWGTIDSKHELIDDPRPLYTGDPQISPVSGCMEPHYPAWKRNLFRYFVTLPIILLCLIVTFGIMLSIFELQEFINRQIEKERFTGWVGVLPKILLALVINVLEEIYKKIAHWLNDKENYRLQATYENHLIIKLVVVQFINNFLALFYIAFYLKDMKRLKQTLATTIITKQLIGNLKESILPYVLEKLKVYQMTYKLVEETVNMDDGTEEIAKAAKAEPAEEEEPVLEMDDNPDASPEQRELYHSKESNEKFTLTQAEVESSMKTYEDTFEDYLEMFIQFGYVILFSSAFPLAAVCALVNNVIEIRSDAFKLCSSMQRPFSQRVENIGTWQDAMEVMGVIGVLVNCALLGTTGQVGRAFPWLSTAGVILVVVFLEHIIIAVKFAIAYAIPDIPHWVSMEMAKLEFNRREALKKLEQATMQTHKENLSRESTIPTTSTTETTREPSQKVIEKPNNLPTPATSKPSVKKQDPSRVWPPAMADVAANFNVFSDLEKIRSPPTSPSEPETPISPATPISPSAPILPPTPKSEDEKKKD